VSHTNAAGDTRLDSYAMKGDRVDAGSKKVLLAVRQPFANHNGGNVVLGPDGDLWLGLGDGGAGGDPGNRAQNPNEALGKMLRIDPLHPRGGRPYAIPATNPYAKGGGRPEIFLSGVRNPWRYSFDRKTHDLWIGDVGQDAIEEIDHLAAGMGAGTNLGWSAFEGTARYNRKRQASGKVIGPVFEMKHSDGWCSVTGGVVYRGKQIPALDGAYLFGDYCKPGLNALRLDGERVRETAVIAGDTPNLVSINEDGHGEVYLLSLTGTVSRVDPAG
jgi:glucose/arabinose dehydrogenase